jgi:hypothetical protein
MTVLSDPSAKVQRVWHPWRTIRNRPDITVRWRRLDGRLREWCADIRTITPDPRQLQRERRCTATHEAIRAERGDRCGDPKTELLVEKASARRLIGIYPLTEAVLFHGTTDLAAFAEELWVDEKTAQIRLEHLHPAERGYIERRLAAREGAA